MSDFVASDLSDLYFDVPNTKPRYTELLEFFSQKYDGSKPDFFARSPGRVNIIGDHIDYSFFPCLPAAISFDTLMAAKVIKPDGSGSGKPGIVKLVNVDKRFSAEEFDAVADVPIEGNSWANYFKCSWITGIRYAVEHKLIDPKAPLPGLEIAVSGNVPAGGGLSSSAAFVVASALLTLHSLVPGEIPIDRHGLTKLSATCEQLVGVNSGGMDQAASIFGKKDNALLVSFRPELSAEPLRFQVTEDPLVFLIANSLVVSAKLETAPIHYNLRVVEVTIAANLLAAKLGNLDIPQDGNLRAGTLYGVLVKKYGSLTTGALRGMIEAVNQNLDPAGYTEEQAADALGINVSELKAKYMSEFPVRFEKLNLYQRSKHVYEETLRVLDFVNAMKNGSPAEVLGDLMNASQASAFSLYENSHPDCDELCKIARKAGALGSRVTGAGWGGCTVHLVTRSNAEKVRKALQTEYYDIKHPNAPTDALIETRPSSGTALFDGNLESLLQ